jgi:hypothetical protein
LVVSPAPLFPPPPPRGEDRTRADDYEVEAGDPGVEAVPSTVGG